MMRGRLRGVAQRVSTLGNTLMLTASPDTPRVSAFNTGDLVLVAVAFRSNGVSSTVSIGGGFTEIYNTEVIDTYSLRFAVAYKVMTAEDDRYIDVTYSGAYGSSTYPLGMSVTFSGVDPFCPMDVTPVTATGTNSGLPDSPSITPITPGALIVAVGGASADDYQVTPAGDMEWSDDYVDPYDGAVYMATKAWGGGAFDPAAWVSTPNTDLAWAAATLALRPAYL